MILAVKNIWCKNILFQWYLCTDSDCQDEKKSRTWQNEDFRIKRWWEWVSIEFRIFTFHVSDSLSPKCLPRPNISNIQSRPLPQPAVYERKSDHIYQSPIRETLGNKRLSPGFNNRARAWDRHIPTAKYHQNHNTPAVSRWEIILQHCKTSD